MLWEGGDTEMDMVLNEIEARVLGCLIEKEMTTPEYYPLSLNALVNACNQKSNRNPVLSLDEATVLKGLEGLRHKGLARESRAPGDRVSKYYQDLFSRFDLSKQETAVITELMLRGPQTAGELRLNAGRMAPLESLAETEETLRALMEHDPPLVIKLAREAGRKESRYMHLLSGEISPEGGPSIQEGQFPPDRVAARPEATLEEIAMLKEEVTGLRTELEELRREFDKFKSQF